MKVPLIGTVTDKLEFWVGVGIAAVIVLGYLGKKTAAAATAVGQAVDPTSTNNIFYRGANAVGGVIADDPSFSLGGWIYSATHPDPTSLPDNPQAKRAAAVSGAIATDPFSNPLPASLGVGAPDYSNTVNTTADPYATPTDPSVPGGGYPVF